MANESGIDIVEMYPTGVFETIPANGIEIFFGPDIIMNVSSSLGLICQDSVPSSQCVLKLNSILEPPARNLEVRYHVMQPWHGISASLHSNLYAYIYLAWKAKYWRTKSVR
jgi:hypothetical protein